ncbi:hypothetical protein Scep_024426 [Stephania cephalantha]|uniref:Uncharacterized protein n=1 Tax=Stephania cephalantha TaxID=152367 RepID=A0AAP0HY94_9MAGN
MKMFICIHLYFNICCEDVALAYIDGRRQMVCSLLGGLGGAQPVAEEPSPTEGGEREEEGDRRRGREGRRAGAHEWRVRWRSSEDDGFVGRDSLVSNAEAANQSRVQSARIGEHGGGRSCSKWSSGGVSRNAGRSGDRQRSWRVQAAMRAHLLCDAADYYAQEEQRSAAWRSGSGGMAAAAP